MCPSKGALEISAPSKSKSARTFRPSAVLTGTAAVLALVIAGTTISGAFNWTMPGLSKPAETGASISVDEIRGSMSFAEVSQATGISGEAIKKRFGITESDMQAPMKTLAEAHGFNVEADVRTWVAEQTAAPSK